MERNRFSYLCVLFHDTHIDDIIFHFISFARFLRSNWAEENMVFEVLLLVIPK